MPMAKNAGNPKPTFSGWLVTTPDFLAAMKSTNPADVKAEENDKPTKKASAGKAVFKNMRYPRI